MRCGFALVVGVLTISAPAMAVPPKHEPASTEAVLRWINDYRLNPEPARVPAAVRALARLGALRDPDSAGVYVGFVAGIIGSNPERAEDLIARMFPLPHDADWAIVRAIAYSGLPEWKRLLRNFAWRMPERRVMIDSYIAGKLPALEAMDFAKSPPPYEQLKDTVREKILGKEPARNASEPGPEAIDVLWGYYFATGGEPPILRLVAMLQLVNEEDNVEKLTLGNMAKFTLATNAARDVRLLEILKRAHGKQSKETRAVLDQVIAAAETMDAARIRKEALAAIDELKRKGPGTRRKLSFWGQVGQGALSLGCIGAAAAGLVAVGLPCVVGGALSTGALYYLGSQQ